MLYTNVSMLILLLRDSVNFTDTYCIVPVTDDTSVEEVMKISLDKFAIDSKDINRYRLVEVSLEKGGNIQTQLVYQLHIIIFTFPLAVHERTMDNNESPWEIIKNVARVSKMCSSLLMIAIN